MNISIEYIETLLLIAAMVAMAVPLLSSLFHSSMLMM